VTNEELYQQIQLEVLERIKPQKGEEDLLKKKFEEVVRKIKLVLTKSNIQAKIELTGSFSRDTWLSGNRDIDIFVIMPYDSTVSPNDLLQEIKKEIKYRWVRKHAKHPYLYAETDGIVVEILPCYEYKPNRELRSAVDRSPSHTRFIAENLPVGSNDEVRLLKQFMHGVGTYGAEIKIHGFSGYLVELMIIHFGGKFINVLKNATTLLQEPIVFKENLVVDKSKFEDDPVVVIDPTDDNRNVASALKDKALDNFIVAAKKYLKNPSLEFFFPNKMIINGKNIREMKSCPLEYIAILHKEPDIADDILWGQIRKFEKSIQSFLKTEDMDPIYVDSIISNEEIMTVIVTTEFHTKSTRWINGPPIVLDRDDEFLQKYSNDNTVIFGPSILEGRWKVFAKQEKRTLQELIQIGLETNKISQPSHLNLKHHTIYSREELLEKITNDSDKMRFLYTLLKGKPIFL